MVAMGKKLSSFQSIDRDSFQEQTSSWLKRGGKGAKRKKTSYLCSVIIELKCKAYLTKLGAFLLPLCFLGP